MRSWAWNFLNRRDRSRPIRRTLLHAVGVGALVTLVGASGAGVTYALWSSSATDDVRVTSGQLGVTVATTGLDSAVFANHLNTVTGSFTLTNTTMGKPGVAMPTTVRVTATDDELQTMAGRFTATVWDATSAQGCVNGAAPTTVRASGSLAALPALSVGLVPNEPRVYCVRLVAPERTLLGVADGSFTLTTTVAAELKYNGTSAWTTSGTALSNHSTQHVYTAVNQSTEHWMRIANATNSNTTCLDVEGEVDSDSVRLIDFACKADSANTANQRWKLVKSGDYYRIVTQLPGARSFLEANGTVRMSAAATDEGLWQLQRVATGVHQLVNKSSGLCLTTGARSAGIAPIIASPCSAATSRFSFTQTATIAPPVVNPIADPAESLTCTFVRNSDALFVGWGKTTEIDYKVLFRADGAGAWSTIAEGVRGTGYTFTDWKKLMTGNGTAEIRVTDGVHVKSIQLNRSGSEIWCG